MQGWAVGTWMLLAFAVAGCATTGSVSNIQEKSMHIRPGTSSDQVLALLGTPGDRSFKGNAEAWQYCSTGFSHDQYVTVWLFEGKVEGLTTYNRSDAMGVCSQTFTSIDWGQAPDDLKVKLTIDQN